MLDYEDMQKAEMPAEHLLSQRVRHLEKMIKEQMKVIKEQQMTIQNQKNIIESQNNGSPGFDDSLEDLIDREENSCESDEEDV